MRYWLYSTREAAEQAESEISAALGLGQPVMITTRWSEIYEHEGQFAIVSPDGTGTEIDFA